DYRQVDKQGTLATTNRALDLAINGRGFVVTNIAQDGSGIWQYTRDGALFAKAVDLGTDSDSDGQNDQGTLLITSNGSYVYGWAADPDGNILETNSLGSLTPVLYGNNAVFPSKATTTINLQANISASDIGRQNVGLPFVDQEGNSRSLSIGFNAGLRGLWTLDMSCVDLSNQPVDVVFDPADIEFDGSGKLIVPADGLLNVTVSDAVGPQSFVVDLSKVTQFSDNNQLTVVTTDQDGYIAGRLHSAYFNGTGTLVGSYTNGELKNLFKLPVATFAADNNLEAKSGNIFVQTAEAGDLKLNSLGSPTSTTQFVVGALEQSNVDLTDQFSKMIVTQRAYSSAAKVLTTADEMTQAARDLKR
ncbi:MAG: flagellar hook-basal body complex protein, partial [Rhodospirillaceae bacterium]|nr:flagellar hook-basal body complex protein [Rhodospirillaceae bacterium]